MTAKELAREAAEKCICDTEQGPYCRVHKKTEIDAMKRSLTDLERAEVAEAELAKLRLQLDEQPVTNGFEYDRTVKALRERAEAAERKLAEHKKQGEIWYDEMSRCAQEHAEAERELLEALQMEWALIGFAVKDRADRLRKLREGLAPVTDSPSTRGGKDGIEAAPLLSEGIPQPRKGKAQS